MTDTGSPTLGTLILGVVLGVLITTWLEALGRLIVLGKVKVIHWVERRAPALTYRGSGEEAADLAVQGVVMRS